MSTYTMMCAACPDHAFLVVDDTDQAHHAGIGNLMDGGQAADGARRDAAHRPQPIGVDSLEAQNGMYERLVRHVLDALPQARFLLLDTSDQSDGYGFVITGVTDGDGAELLDDRQLLTLADGVAGELADLDWSERGGLLDEADNGAASIRL